MVRDASQKLSLGTVFGVKAGKIAWNNVSLQLANRRLTRNGFSSSQVSEQSAQLFGMLQCRVPEHSPATPGGQNTSWLFVYFYWSILVLKNPWRANNLSFLLTGNSVWLKGLLSESLRAPTMNKIKLIGMKHSSNLLDHKNPPLED